VICVIIVGWFWKEMTKNSKICVCPVCPPIWTHWNWTFFRGKKWTFFQKLPLFVQKFFSPFFLGCDFLWFLGLISEKKFLWTFFGKNHFFWRKKMKFFVKNPSYFLKSFRLFLSVFLNTKRIPTFSVKYALRLAQKTFTVMNLPIFVIPGFSGENIFWIWLTNLKTRNNNMIDRLYKMESIFQRKKKLLPNQ